jgi:uncharacterized delta-60 repeat protein
MKKSGWAKGIILLFIVVLYSGSTPAQTSYNYLITAKNEEIHFVSRPELGYVVVSREETGAVEALDGTLRQFGARDIRAIRGLGRQGVSVVFSRRSPGENENTITKLRTQSQIKYVAPLFSSNEETVAIIPEIVVRMSGKSDDKQLKALCQSINLRIKHKLQFTECEYLIEVLTTDANGVFDAVEQLNQASFVEWAVPNVAFRPQLLGQVIPNDTYFPDQWHLNNTGQSGGTPNADINAPEAWEITTGDPNIIVAVLDDGVDTDHPDLVNNIVAGYDFYNWDNTPDPAGNEAHGTACAGLIAAQGNNDIGVAGVAWNCKIMPIRISGDDEFITEADIATAIRWAANNGADVLSNSWGADIAMPVIHSAIIDVTEPEGIGREGKGCVVLFASGNWVSGGSVAYPAKYPEVIAVGSTDHNDAVWYYSGSGPELDIVAPSGDTNLQGNIWTTDIVGSSGFNNRDPNILNYTDKMGGTSGACPIAAGIAALVLSLDPNLTNIDVQDIMQTSAVDLGTTGFDSYYGFGRVDARFAVNLATVFPKRQWVARYNGPGNGEDGVRALVVDNLGNVYVTGYSTGSGTNYDYATVKYDTNGSELWVKRYNGPPGDSSDEVQDLAVDNLGNVYVTGYSTGSSTGDDYATIKYDPNGSELWVKRYNGPGNGSDSSGALAVDSSGNVYVTGYSGGSDTSSDYATIKYDPNGNELWVKRYNGPGNSSDRAYALAVDSLGNVYVTGYSSGSGTSYDYTTIKYDFDGNELWVARYNAPGNIYDYAEALAIDNLGNVYVTGSSSSDYATIKYDANGNQKWVGHYNGPGNSNDSASFLVVDNSGNVYVTGNSYGSGTGDDYATIKYDPNGNELWVKRYNGTENGSDVAHALAVDDLGNVYVTGGSYGSGTSGDYATIEYDPNGNELWVRRYNGPGNGDDYALALAVDGSGSVYVTGGSTGSGTNYDYATIKYSQRNYCTQVLDGDIDGNCRVDIADVALFADQWLNPFDFIDYTILAENWLECKLAYQGTCW